MSAPWTPWQNEDEWREHLRERAEDERDHEQWLAELPEPMTEDGGYE